MKNLTISWEKKKLINNWKNINNEIIDITKIYIYCRCSPRLNANKKLNLLVQIYLGEKKKKQQQSELIEAH